MTQTVTLELPAELVERARAVAERSGRRLEDVLVEWLRSSERSLDEPSDEEVLALCDSQLPEADQQELGDLLASQREGRLAPDQKGRLEDLLRAYRYGLVRKAQALQTAMSRGLRPPLG
jgi:hypothetical protein